MQENLQPQHSWGNKLHFYFLIIILFVLADNKLYTLDLYGHKNVPRDSIYIILLLWLIWHCHFCEF